MSNRFERLEVLRVILGSSGMSSHEQILKELAKNGIDVTQATLSRDLTKLRAMKVIAPDGYRYVLPNNPLYRRTFEPEVVPTFLRSTGFESIQFSGNIAVIHTRPGYAGGLASDIDSHKLSTIIGSVAGDDTVIVVLAEDADRQQFVDELAELIPAVKSIML